MRFFPLFYAENGVSTGESQSCRRVAYGRFRGFGVLAGACTIYNLLPLSNTCTRPPNNERACDSQISSILSVLITHIHLSAYRAMRPLSFHLFAQLI
jgi:hypothetical protein